MVTTTTGNQEEETKAQTLLRAAFEAAHEEFEEIDKREEFILQSFIRSLKKVVPGLKLIDGEVTVQIRKNGHHAENGMVRGVILGILNRYMLVSRRGQVSLGEWTNSYGGNFITGPEGYDWREVDETLRNFFLDKEGFILTDLLVKAFCQLRAFTDRALENNKKRQAKLQELCQSLVPSEPQL
ncbi:MAG: hypothetical protein PHW72_01150 [Candidatus Pacebacteria bacterium]|nr:hypothetical protein [Candidatus Paceibacterota bacterium]